MRAAHTFAVLSTLLMILACPAHAGEDLRSADPQTVTKTFRNLLANSQPKARESWRLAVIKHMNGYRNYPLAACPASGVVHLHFTLDRAGRVVEAGISSTSGSKIFDEEGLQLVRRAAPYPPPPPENPEVHLLETYVHFESAPGDDCGGDR